MVLLSGSTPWLLGGVLLLSLVFRVLFGGSRIRRDGVALKKPPNTLPLVGNGLLFLQARQKLFSWFVKCERIFGHETFEISVPTLPPGVVINDPRNLEFVYKHEGTFGKGEFVKRPLADLFGHGIINSDGELWRVQRRAGMQFLNAANLRVLTDIALPQYLADSIGYLGKRANGQVVVDLQTVFHEITSQLMGKMAYNMEMHADDEFTVAFDYASGGTAERIQNPLWYITEIFSGAKLRKSIAIVKAYGQQIVSNAVKDRQQGKSRSLTASENKLDEISGSLIQSLLDSIGDESMIADSALNYLSAGRDTVAQALTWVFYLLMRHRYAAAKVRKEVQELLRDHDASFGSQDVDPTLFNPAVMPYTMAVFYETLRLYPPIPFEIRQADHATTLPDGTFLPKGSVLVWCTWAMNRSKMTFGEDADAFRPERWLVDGSFVSKSASEFPTFNGGARTCLGKRMADLIAVQVIATLSWLFDFMPAEDGERVSKSSLTLPMEGGLPSYVRTRTHSIEQT